MNVSERLWSKVRRAGDDECWDWTAAVDTNGYGVISIDNRKAYAHRVAHELVNGPIPSGLEILHSCDRKVCVNPRHLRADTRRQNVAEAWDRGLVKLVTHCRQGHEYTIENTYVDPRGGRVCRICRLRRMREFVARHR